MKHTHSWAPIDNFVSACVCGKFSRLDRADGSLVIRRSIEGLKNLSMAETRRANRRLRPQRVRKWWELIPSTSRSG